MSKARPYHDTSDQAEAYRAEIHSPRPDRPPGATAHETASPVRFPMPMDVDSGVWATTREQDSSYGRLMYAEVVGGLNTAVFRPSPSDTSSYIVEPSISDDQVKMAEAVSIVSAYLPN